MPAKFKLQLHVLPLTPSEKKSIGYCMENSLWNVLYITRSRGNDLIVEIEKKDVRKTKKHIPPFKYQMRYYNKWGKLKMYKTGNYYDKKENFLIDDFTEINRIH